MANDNKTDEKDFSAQSLLEVEQRRKEIYRSMSAEDKLNIASDLYYSALALKKAHYRRHHPEWSEEEIDKKVKEWMMYART